jgi:tetratricopeptide (TPR) repeat protein
LQWLPAHITRYWGIFWVDVSSAKTAESDYLNISNMIGSPATNIEAARRTLANCKDTWLLILDNADDPGIDYEQYIPTGTSGTILLTSRNEECSQLATAESIDLAGLSHDEAVQLLLKLSLKVRHVESSHYERYNGEAQAVIKLLGSHPLALIQAGTYVSQGRGCTLAQYPEQFTRQRDDMMRQGSRQAKSRYQNVYATFDVSAEMLKNMGTEKSHDALLLLSIMSMLGQSRLPWTFFQEVWAGASHVLANPVEDETVLNKLSLWHVDQVPAVFQLEADQGGSFQLNEATQLLKAFALISVDVSDGGTSLSMHPLIHAWARDRQEQREQKESWLAAACMIALSYANDEAWVTRNRDLQPHLQAVIAPKTSMMFECGSQVMIVRFLLRCCWWLYWASDDKSLDILFREMFHSLQSPDEIVMPQWLDIYRLYGLHMVDMGNYAKAVHITEKVVDTHKERQLAEDHPDLIYSQHALAVAYQYNRQVQEAIQILLQVAEIQSKKLTEDHPSRLASQHALAVIYRENGQGEEAIQILEHVVDFQKQLPEDHPDRLDSQHALAIAYWKLCRRHLALALMRHLVDVRTQSLQEGHPDRVSSEEWLKFFEDQLEDDPQESVDESEGSPEEDSHDTFIEENCQAGPQVAPRESTQESHAATGSEAEQKAALNQGRDANTIKQRKQNVSATKSSMLQRFRLSIRPERKVD